MHPAPGRHVETKGLAAEHRRGDGAGDDDAGNDKEPNRQQRTEPADEADRPLRGDENELGQYQQDGGDADGVRDQMDVHWHGRFRVFCSSPFIVVRPFARRQSRLGEFFARPCRL
jgi:hypothetical protein